MKYPQYGYIGVMRYILIIKRLLLAITICIIQGMYGTTCSSRNNEFKYYSNHLQLLSVSNFSCFSLTCKHHRTISVQYEFNICKSIISIYYSNVKQRESMKADVNQIKRNQNA